MEVLFIFIWLVCLIAGTVSGGERKIGAGLGFVACFCLSFLGLIIVLSSPKLRDASGNLIVPPEYRSAEPNPAQPNVDDLIKYAGLYEKGLITKEEFDLQKAKLMK